MLKILSLIYKSFLNIYISQLLLNILMMQFYLDVIKLLKLCCLTDMLYKFH